MLRVSPGGASPGTARWPPRRLVLAVAPGAARAVLVELFPACTADHVPIIGPRIRARTVNTRRQDREHPGKRQPGGAGRQAGKAGAGLGTCGSRAGQAAFARRMRRRRSEDRSSSLRPPQVPYFSGRLQRVVQALGPHRAGGADGLGLALADVPLRLALTVRAEEEHDITAAARRVILPAPVRPLHQGGLTTYLRHDLLSSTSSRTHSCQASALARHSGPKQIRILRTLSQSIDAFLKRCGIRPVASHNAWQSRGVPCVDRGGTRMLSRASRQVRPPDNDATQERRRAGRMANSPARPQWDRSQHDDH